MGPASAFFHGSFVAFPALGDSWSIVIWESFIVSYNLTRMLNWSKSTALSMFAIICVVAMLFQVAWGKTEMLMGGLVIVSVIMVGCSPNVRTSVAGNGWLWASIATFGAAVFVWKKSFSTGPWCNPHTGLGHSVWHILAAFLTLTIYYYFREEQNPEPSDPHLHFEARMRDGLSGENPCVPVRFAETSSADGGHPWGMRKYSGSSETYPIAQIPGPFEFRPR